MDNNSKCKIVSAENDTGFKNNETGDEITSIQNESSLQLESLLTDISTFGKEFLCCSKSSLPFSKSICEADSVSNYDT